MDTTGKHIYVSAYMDEMQNIAIQPDRQIYIAEKIARAISYLHDLDGFTGAYKLYTPAGLGRLNALYDTARRLEYSVENEERVKAIIEEGRKDIAQ